jgi:DNA-binding transcriptional LysR family regulator
VVRHGSFSKAASELGLSQPALSKTIHRLERLLGVSLFSRSSLGVTPTAHCQRIIMHLQLIEAEMEVVFSKGDKSPHLAIGCHPLSSESIVAPALRRLLALSPEMSIAAIEGRRRVLVADLRVGALDLVVAPITNDDISPDLVEDELFYDRMVIVVRANHPLANQKNLTLKDLLGYRWLVPPADSYIRRQIDRELLCEASVIPKLVDAVNSVNVMKSLMCGQDYLAVVSTKSVYRELSEGIYVPLKGAWTSIPRPFAIIQRRGDYTSSVSRLLIPLLKQVAKEVDSLVPSMSHT